MMPRYSIIKDMYVKQCTRNNSINYYFLIAMIIFIATNINNNLYADDSSIKSDIHDCIFTPEVLNYDQERKDMEYNYSNNLVRGANSTNTAFGNKIFVTGKVLDMHCRPIKNAMINIWHTNNYGSYQKMGNGYVGKVNLSKDNKNNILDEDIDNYFAGNGTSYTDSLGNYSFVTIMPKSRIDKESPYINVEITHQDFMPFYTVIFFQEDYKNKVLSTIKPLYRKRLLINQTGNYSYSFDFVLHGVESYNYKVY